MLRNEVLIWVLIVQIMSSCIVAIDVYARVEADRVRKSMESIIEETEVEPVITPSVDNVEEKIEATLEITALNTKTYYDVPLDEDIQDHIIFLCEQHHIDPALVIAMIHKESRYNAKAVGDGGNSLGLMQIQPKWHKARMEKYNCKNLFDPYQNIIIGIDILDELFSTGKSTEWVLMAYNGGRAYANEKTALGIVSDYATTVMANARTFETYEVVRGV